MRHPSARTRLAALWAACALVFSAEGGAAQQVPDLRPALSPVPGDEIGPEIEAAADEGIEEAEFELTEFPDGRRPKAGEDDPYAPLGIRLGAFLLYPAIEGYLGYSNNVFSSTIDPAGGSYYRLAPELELRSDWSRHWLRGFVAADHESFFRQSGETTTAFESEIDGRLDITSNDVAGVRLAYAIVPESRGDPNVPQAVVEPPDSEVAVAEATYAHRFGRVEVALRGAAEAFTYENALLIDGTVVDNSDRDYRELNGAIRTSVDIADGERAIFVEVGGNRRKYRQPFDSSGVRRGSQGYDVLIGIAFEKGAPLSGEIAVGYQQQRPDDPNLETIDSIALLGSLVWAPNALTTFTFSGSILPEESTLVSTSPGTLVYSAEVGVEHALRRNLIAAASYAYAQTDYVGSNRVERDQLAVAGIRYLANRWLSFRVDASYHHFDSNIGGEDYDEARIEMGIRLQR